MGKYDRFDKYQETKQQPASAIHPIWRGIGCMMLILIPVVAYAAADTLFVDVYGSGLTVIGFNVIPGSGDLYTVFFSLSLGNESIRITPFHIVFTILFSVVGFLIFSLAYAVIYRLTGPPKYGPTDAPPPRRSGKGRRR